MASGFETRSRSRETGIREIGSYFACKEVELKLMPKPNF